ncbi:MAG: hypothetical protein SWH61_14520 [Thermodesulfobacteriota bacterium]|nr:hypothetical protein [Thermodesulfobacteriota bacterium]
MKDDPVIQRIRDVRRQISEEHGHDTQKLIKHYQELEKKTGRKFFHRKGKQEKVA